MEQENQRVRLTRAAKRRAEATADSEVAGLGRPLAKKRVVLGELTNVLRNDAVASSSKSGSETERSKETKKRKKPSSKSKKPVFSIAEPTALDTDAIVSPKKRKTKSDEEIEESYGDPQMCIPYVSDVYRYLHEMESDPKKRPVPDYMEKVQGDITANMRGILVDWLVEVAEEYKLNSDTIFLAVSYVDRFLSVKSLPRQKLQLVGVSSMLIASKYEEIKPPRVEEFCYITDNTYTKDEAVKMEAEMLKCFEFELGNPTIKTFLRRFPGITQESNKPPNLQLECLGNYLAELSLLDYSCVKFLPSLVASSVIFLARFMIRPKVHPWTPKVQKYTGYKAGELKQCVFIILDLYFSRRAGSLQSIRSKYKQHRFKFAALTPSPPDIPSIYFEDISHGQ